MTQDEQHKDIISKIDKLADAMTTNHLLYMEEQYNIKTSLNKHNDRGKHIVQVVDNNEKKLDKVIEDTQQNTDFRRLLGNSTNMIIKGFGVISLIIGIVWGIKRFL